MARGERGVIDELMEMKKKRRWRRRRWWRVEEAPPLSATTILDPLVALGGDLMAEIMKKLDARSVARSVAVSTAWYQIGSDDRLWSPLCEELLKGKAHIPRLVNMRGASKLGIYSMCMVDGKRVRIVKEDLCEHAWEVRLKESAPEFWRRLDPSWQGTGPPMHRYFHTNGSHTADPYDKIWGGHECSYSIVTSFAGEGQIRSHYVRINRWPPLFVSRKEDWSWELSNHLCCYNSIPDPEKGGTGPIFPVW